VPAAIRTKSSAAGARTDREIRIALERGQTVVPEIGLTAPGSYRSASRTRMEWAPVVCGTVMRLWNSFGSRAQAKPLTGTVFPW
jgi:hypothetical protein